MATILQKPGLSAFQWDMGLALVLVVCGTAVAQSADFHQTFVVTSSEPVMLDIALPTGELAVSYSRDGQVSITASAQATDGVRFDDNFFKAVLAIEQNGNHLKLRHVSNPAYQEDRIRIRYRIDVPYRTEVTSNVEKGRQSFSGIMGPVKVAAGKGDIQASYLSKGLQAQTDNGNLDLQVIGEHVEAKTGNGNITGARLGQGVSAETGDGDITLTVVGPSTATVRQGSGRIDVSGAQGNFTGSTPAGELHVKAAPHGDWQLSSASGNIRIELPPAAKFDLDASTDSGQLEFERDDITKLEVGAHHFHQVVNAGGQHIEAHTGSGRILIR